MSRKRVMHGPSEIAGQNCYSVLGLRELGVYARSVVLTPHPFGYPYDTSLGIDVRKKVLAPVYLIKLLVFLLRACIEFDTFHFHFGHSILFNLELPLYDILQKAYYYEFHGSDLRNTSSGPLVNILDKKTIRRNAKICRHAKGIILHDDELIPFLPKNHAPVFVVPLRVKIDCIPPHYPSDIGTGIVRVVHAPSKRATKGTEHVIAAMNKIVRENSNVDFILVEGKSQEEALGIYSKADIIIDQLLCGTYGVFAIEGMAMGKPVITFISDDMRERLPTDLPIESANPKTIYDVVNSLVHDPEKRRALGIAGRKYVEKYHDYRKGARMLLEVYEGKVGPINGREAFEHVWHV